MTTKAEIQVDAMLCQGICEFAQHPKLLGALIEANNSCEYITEWAVLHLRECPGPMIANLVGGGSSIYSTNRGPKVVFPSNPEERV